MAVGELEANLGPRSSGLPFLELFCIRTVLQPDREIALLGDGSYAAVILVQRCQRLKRPVKLVSRLRLDACLHAVPAPRPKGKRGPKPKKGARLPSLETRLADPKTQWQKLKVLWYGGEEKEIEVASDECLWYRRGLEPVLIR